MDIFFSPKSAGFFCKNTSFFVNDFDLKGWGRNKLDPHMEIFIPARSIGFVRDLVLVQLIFHGFGMFLGYKYSYNRAHYDVIISKVSDS